MPEAIEIVIGPLNLSAELNDSPAARAFAAMLPLEFTMSRWGEEYYGDCGIHVEPVPDSKEVMEIGELALWPIGNALCIFFGPTPASTGERPQAASPVIPVGRLTSGHEPLKKLGDTVRVRIEVAK
jgi:hypothetical protein